MGINHIGIGIKSGENRAVHAAEEAISSPSLGMALESAANVLLYVKGGSDMSITESYAASKVVRNAAPAEANIVFGSVIDREMQDEVRVTVIVTRKRAFAEDLEAMPAM